MNLPEQLTTIIERISQGEHTEDDLNTLCTLLTSGEQADLLQLGKYNINIGQGQNIQITETNIGVLYF
ncbi:hypothetical protein [Leptothoe spongobia]|uniref:Effector-associated domain-containing protein n=1 Tax=Leptothoe spongobia TAU-MAC 1115 TaxID=1967444 RepID=A0A947DJ92_9CYAN|nr:hypothetical protein [Leptothoe spongobia]MBT9317673.1 hypothetical protein [Leptothoe spongobia TAU-MAC 1115]